MNIDGKIIINGKEYVPTACPDGIPGCAVLHLRERHACTDHAPDFDAKEYVVKALRRVQDRHGNRAFDIDRSISWREVAKMLDQVVDDAKKWRVLCYCIENGTDLITSLTLEDAEKAS